MENGHRIFREDTADYLLETLSARFVRDAVSFEFSFRNDGELTIRSPSIEFRESRNARLFDEREVLVMKSVNTRITLEDVIIYPGDEREIARAQLLLECKRDLVLTDGDYKLGWRVFLDNSPPSTGEIDLGTMAQKARARTVEDPEGYSNLPN